jgi:hypothetical protein
LPCLVCNPVLVKIPGDTTVRCAVSALLAIVTLLGTDDADVARSYPITIPHGFPTFAIVASIGHDGRCVTIGQNVHFGGTVLHDQPEIEARAYTIAGRQLDARATKKRLSQNSAVLISTDGKFPSREYTQYLKPRTVVFVFKTPQLPNRSSFNSS